MSYLISAGLIIAGIIHILPISGVWGVHQLHQLYGIRLDDGDLTILMRHRAILFALLGTLMLVAVFKPHYQILAIAGGLVSTCSFLWLAWSGNGYGEGLEKVVMADIIAIAALLTAAGALLFKTSH